MVYWLCDTNTLHRHLQYTINHYPLLKCLRTVSEVSTLTIPDTIKYIPVTSSPCRVIVSPTSNNFIRAAEVIKSTASGVIPSNHTTLRSNSMGFCGEIEAGALSCRFILTSTICVLNKNTSYAIFSSGAPRIIPFVNYVFFVFTVAEHIFFYNRAF